jgi:hypothetical protein
MRKLVKIIEMISLASASFAGGALLATVLHLFPPLVGVTLHNASGKRIESLRLTHEHGIVEITNLSAGSFRVLRFYAPAESSYRIKVVYSDGEVLESDGRYVQASDAETVTITGKDITSENHFLGCIVLLNPNC